MNWDSLLNPVESYIRLTSRRMLNSIAAFSSHNHFHFAIKISGSNYGFDNERKLMTIPFYFVPFLSEDLKEGKFLEGHVPLKEKA